VYKRAVTSMLKKLKLSFYSGDTGSKKCKGAMVKPIVGCGGVWRQAVGFVWLQSPRCFHI
jgi:hypothetical protein